MARTRTSPRRPARPTARAGSATHDRDLELAGLALIAVGVFLAFVEYFGSAGGRVGEGLAHALALLVGAVAYAVPVALVIAGGVLTLRPLLPAPLDPLRAGAVCLLVGLCLALAAGTLGLGPGGPLVWARAALEARGGLLGGGLLWLVEQAFSVLAAHLLAVFLLLSGALLVTGVTVANVVERGRRRAAGVGRVVRTSTSELTTTISRAAATRRARPEPVAATAIRPARGGRDEPPEADADFDADPEPEPDPEPGVVLGEALEPTGELADPEVSEPGPVDGPAEQPELAPPPRTRAVSPEDLTPQGRYRASVTDAEDFPWRLPDPALLERSTAEASRPDTAGQEKVAAALLETLGNFGVDARMVGTVAGPHITRFELRLAPGVKVGKVAQLKDDLAYGLAATDIRVLAPIPGKQAVGVEVPNARRRIVHLGDVYGDAPDGWSPLTVWLGKDVAGRPVGADLARMPHLLVAGTTGAGKSGAINAMLASILLRATPREVRLVLVDPKQVELNFYESIPHLLTPVITSPKLAANALANLVREMEQRYGLMSLAKTRSLPELNRSRTARGEPELPYILCVIDELADLMMVAPADVEDAIIRLAQKARAVGIHLVLATQSPRVDVITGMIKANVPSRIAFAVSSQTDSRVILDQNGAESLLGQGDMLFSPVGTSRLQRIQGAYVDEDQVATLTDWWRRQGEPELQEELLTEVVADGEVAPEGEDDGFDPDEDPLLEEAIFLVASMQTASTSMLQRRLRLGYTRAGRLIDMLERRGVISGYEGSKPRQVLVSEADVPRIVAALRADTGAPAAAIEPGADAPRAPVEA